MEFLQCLPTENFRNFVAKNRMAEAFIGIASKYKNNIQTRIITFLKMTRESLGKNSLFLHLHLTLFFQLNVLLSWTAQDMLI